MQYQSRESAGCVLVTPDKKIFTVRNCASGFWGFPKGGKKDNETPGETALRELREESGIVLDETAFAHSMRDSRITIFIAPVTDDVKSQVVIDNIEIDDAAWISMSELKDLPMSRMTERLISRIEYWIQRCM